MEHWQNSNHCITLTDRNFVLNLWIVYCWTASSVNCILFLIKLVELYILSLHILIVQSSLFIVCNFAALVRTWFSMFYCSVFYIGTDGTSDNKFLAVFKATNCTMQLHRMLYRMRLVHVAAWPSAAINIVLPISEKTTTPPITEKANSPEILQA